MESSTNIGPQAAPAGSTEFVFSLSSSYGYLAMLTDRRKRRGVRYSLATILVLAILAKLCGQDRTYGSADGSGLFVIKAQAQLFNTTVANSQMLNSFSHPYPAIGGGVYLTSTLVLTAENSIIAENENGNGVELPKADDCFAYSGTTGTLVSDLVTTMTNCSISVPPDGNIFGADPMLGPLQDNGDSTHTQALLPGSPAIDASFSTGCVNADGSPLTQDQRGAACPAFGNSDPTCDMGAYELVPEADLAVGQHASSNTVPVGACLTSTAVLTNSGPVTATGLVLTDTLPADATVSSVDTGIGIGCVLTAELVCKFGPMPLNSGANITVTVAVTPTASGGMTNTVAVSADEFDPAPGNTASVSTLVPWELFLPLVRR